jgi:hypothetical protein
MGLINIYWESAGKFKYDSIIHKLYMVFNNISFLFPSYGFYPQKIVKSYPGQVLTWKVDNISFISSKYAVMERRQAI